MTSGVNRMRAEYARNLLGNTAGPYAATRAKIRKTPWLR